MIFVTPSFSKRSVFKKVFHPHENERSALSNSSGLKSVFVKLRFRDELVWTIGLTVEIKLSFQISPVQSGRGLGLKPFVFCRSRGRISGCSVEFQININYSPCLSHAHAEGKTALGSLAVDSSCF